MKKFTSGTALKPDTQSQIHDLVAQIDELEIKLAGAEAALAMMKDQCIIQIEIIGKLKTEKLTAFATALKQHTANQMFTEWLTQNP